MNLRHKNLFGDYYKVINILLFKNSKLFVEKLNVLKRKINLIYVISKFYFLIK